jgi:hypothetical protein
MEILTAVVVAGLAWHAILIGAIYVFDLGGGDGIPPKIPEREVLDEGTYRREFRDDHAARPEESRSD